VSIQSARQKTYNFIFIHRNHFHVGMKSRSFVPRPGMRASSCQRLEGLNDATRSNKRCRPTRRRLLKGGAAAAVPCRGSVLWTGFPTIMAQNIKDVVITHVGRLSRVIPQLAAQASRISGSDRMQTVDLTPRMKKPAFHSQPELDRHRLRVDQRPSRPMKKKNRPAIPFPNTNGGHLDAGLFTKG